METKSRFRFAAVFLAIAMLLSLWPVNLVVAKRASAEDAAAGTGDPKYVLDVKTDIDVMAKMADDAATKSVTAGTLKGANKYFTAYFGAKTAVEDKTGDSSKTFEDDYVGTRRINFGGSSNTTDLKNVITFKTDNPAALKVWWVAGGDNRYAAVCDSSGNNITPTSGPTSGTANNTAYISSFDISAAGTYIINNQGGGKNYIFKVEVIEHLPKVYSLDVKTDIDVMAKMADDAATKSVTAGTLKGANKYFTAYFGAKTAVEDKTGDSSKTFEDDYVGTRRINFGGSSDTTNLKNVITFKTDGSATVKVWWVAGGDGRYAAICDSAGTNIAPTSGPTSGTANNTAYISSFDISAAGTYIINNQGGGKNYIFKVEVTEGGSSEPVERGDWSDVSAPVINSATQTSGKAEIKVTVAADVSAAGGDELVVKMYKDGQEVESKRSIAEKTTHELVFNPTGTGTYTFKATLSREGETDKTSATDGSCAFVLPLAKPVISSATNKGNGSVEIKWSAVAEATGYNVYVGSEKKTATPVTDLYYTVEGLTVGTSYDFYVEAVRGADTNKSDAKSATVVAEAQQEWSTTYFGASTSSSKNKVTGDLNRDGEVTVIASGGGGKIVPGGNGSGLTYYYTTIPDSLNFTLKGTFTLDTWAFDNGQEGFGLLTLDRLPAGNLNNSATFWTNQYLMGMTKSEYRWDSDKNQVTYDENIGSKYTMKNGVCVSAVIDGLTPENLSQTADTTFINTIAPKNTFPLETYAVDMGMSAGTYNVIGKSTKELPGTIKGLTTFVFELQRNNTGYFMTYYDENGEIIGRQKFYDPDAMSKLDTEKVYVGFFAARNATVKVSNVTLTTIAPEDDLPAEERPTELIDPTLGVLSATVANSPDYTLMLNANVAGTAEISINDELIGTGELTAKTLFSKDLVLQSGKNYISVVFKPDPDQDLGEYKALANSDPITITLNVNYDNRLSEQKNLYVAPAGNKYGNGGTDYPLDIYTAVSIAQPGQTIIIMEGTYSLKSPVRIERGVDGTADAKIRMIVDPEATSRPVFDFNEACEGFRLGGNYWYVQGFDVTNSGNGSAGFRVCGNYNTLDRIEAYNNGNTGIQISAFRDSNDPRDLWPHDNLILNCTSYNNADLGREDADGFAAKLTIGDGNVFDGCAAYNNADDGWDLYAKVSSGPIGTVTIKNCIAYNNGFMLDGSDAGNGNGFKIGGEDLPGGHKLINSFAFGNKAHGITSNSCPDVEVYNCTSYNNGYTAYSDGKDCNLTLYTNNADIQTAFVVDGFISCKARNAASIKRNSKDATVTSNMKDVEESAFVSTTFGGLERNEDGTLKLGDFLKLKDDADKAIGADFDKPGSSQPSEDIGEIVPDEDLPDPIPDTIPSAGGSGTSDTGDTSDTGNTDKEPIEFDDAPTEIKVTAPAEAFDDTDDIKFNAEPVTEETTEEMFTFDLFFSNSNGDKVQPKVAVTVKIPVPTALVDKTIFVYHVEEDGKYTEIDCKVEDGMIVFTASSFSKYIISTQKLAASGSDDGSSSGTPDSDTSGSTSNPVTGIGIPFTTCVAFIAGAAALTLFKRKNK